MTTDTIEPQRIDQTEFGENGNCQSACLAMMLGLEITDIPNFTTSGQTDIERYKAMQDWLAERGFQLLTFETWTGIFWPPRGFCIGGGKSPRGIEHAVILKDGQLWHDPQPERSGVEKVTTVDLLIPFYPWRVLP